MSKQDPTEHKLTKVQRDALETIREVRVTVINRGGSITDGVFHLRHGRMPYKADFGQLTVRVLEERGLIESIVLEDEPRRLKSLIRITDAGRVALGDWAAGEVSR